MTTTEIQVDRDGHVATITLNAPERLNSLSPEMFDALDATWDALAEDSEVRAVIITGAGRAFCAGAKMQMLEELASPDERPPIPLFTARLKEFYKPVIVAVNGVCAGAGFHFVCDSDIVIASESAYFVDTHVNIGQVAALEPIGMLRRMPLERVLRMVILGRDERLSAEQALDAGIVTEVLAHDGLMARAKELAHIAAAGSPATVQASLRAIWESFNHPLDEAYRRGYEIVLAHRTQHPDALEGAQSFIEKRQPVWQS